MAEENNSKKLRDNNDVARTEWVTFYLGHEKYGISVLYVKEVLKPVKITPVPGAPEFVLGIINLRGSVVTVVDAHRRLSLSTAEDTDNTRIVVVEYKEQDVGIVVDKVAEVVELTDDDIELIPTVGDEKHSEFIMGISKTESDLLVILDLQKFMQVNE